MPRTKVKLAWIESDSARKACFNKRKKGLVQKVSELSTLCDVSACIVIYGRGSNQPILWPDHPTAEKLIRRYLSLPGFVRCKKTVSHETYLEEKVAKMQDKHNKILRSNTVMDMDDLMRQGLNGKPIYELDINEIYGLVALAEEKMKEIHNRIVFFEQAAGDSNYSSVKSDMGVNELGVPPRNGMEWPYEIFGVGGDGRGSGAELGFQMLPQFSGNNIGDSGSVNVAPNMIPYGNIGNFEGDGSGNVGLPQVNYGGNNIMVYFRMLPQYYGNNNAEGSNMGLNFGANSTGNNIGWADGASEAAMELTVLVEVMLQAFLIKMLAKLGKTPTTSSYYIFDLHELPSAPQTFVSCSSTVLLSLVCHFSFSSHHV